MQVVYILRQIIIQVNGPLLLLVIDKIHHIDNGNPVLIQILHECPVLLLVNGIETVQKPHQIQIHVRYLRKFPGIQFIDQDVFPVIVHLNVAKAQNRVHPVDLLQPLNDTGFLLVVPLGHHHRHGVGHLKGLLDPHPGCHIFIHLIRFNGRMVVHILAPAG